VRFGEEPERNHILEYVDVLLARRFTVIAVLLTVVTIVMIRTYKEVPIFRATVQIEINTENPNKVLPWEIQATRDDGLQTQYKVLSSRSLARSVIEDLHLDQSKPQAAAKPGAFSAAFHGATRLVSNTVSYVLASPKPPQTDVPTEEGDPLRSSIDGYLGSLTVSPVLRTRLVNVSYEDSDPRLAALAVNAHAEHFIDQNLRSRFEVTQIASAFLSKELASMKANLEKSLDNLQAYSTAHQILFLEDGKNADTAKLAQLETEYTKAQTERIMKGSAANLLRDQGGMIDPASDTRLTELRREDAKLAVTYKEDYDARKIIRSQITEIEKAIEKERTAAIRRAEADYTAAIDREELFRQAFQAQRERVDKMNQEIVQYNILKGQADSDRTLYDTLLQRLKEAEISSSFTASNIRIVDRAEVPTHPIRPVKTQNLLNGLAIGLALGIGLAFFQEYMDRSFRSPDDITKYMKLPTLAIIPRMGSVMGKGKPGYGAVSNYLGGKKKAEPETNGAPKPQGVELIAQDAPSSLLAEAYRSLRASLILSSPDRPPRTILVSSAIPSEGKTSTAVNLAVSLTQIGARVAIIDGDMRKPRLDKIFSLRHKPGLSNFLSGSEQFKNVIHETAIPNLFVIPCGVIPPNPGELILSNRFKQMLEVLRKYFDYVVLDSPPLNNVSDGRILATTVDGVVLVVKALSTSRHVVLRSLDYLEDSRSRLIGVVLNDYNLKSKGGYYYSYGSGRYYQQYYYQSNENETPEETVKK
jgi:capsular exopolysaccharide synthesis family protein